MTAIGGPHPAPRRGLATWLLLAQAVVLIAGTFTAGVVALVVGPPLIHQHLLEAGHSEGSAELSHIEQAYRDASAISLGIALLTALVAALAVIFFLTRRIRAALAALTSAAAAVSRGRYDVRVPASDAGAEFDALSTAFNEMAGRLDAVEDTRRRLLSDLAHEMRTPIATLSAYLEGADDGVVEWGTATSQVLREQTDRLAKLAGDIDDVSRAQEGRVVLQRKPELVGDLVWAAAEAARAAFTRKGVNLLADPSGAPGATVLVDRQRMAQVLDNLLGNALRHAPPGGVVRIGSQLHEKSVQLVV
ncbi:MAG: HAMP domain-containing protein, partial [Actinomycetota bacterium]|nr:HAMP domain-containing protein [Actinomycetota bacterium]